MFKVLYRCNRTIERHTNSPLADSRRRYLEHLAAGGASPSMMRNAAAPMYRAVQLLDLDVNRPVKRTEVEEAAKRWRVVKKLEQRQMAWARILHRLPFRMGFSEPETAPTILLSRKL
jgi:hypothetical protein